MRSGSLKRGGKDRTVPVREDLEAWLLSYLEAAGIVGARGSRPRPTGWALSAVSVRDQLKRRLRAAGLPQRLRPHSFRVLVVTDLLAQRVPLEDVQYLVGTATRGPHRSTARRAFMLGRGSSLAFS